MLTELRKIDRDRDRSLPPKTIRNVFEKYNLPVDDLMPTLNHKFEDRKVPGQTNYEDVIQYLLSTREKMEQSIREGQAIEEDIR